MSELFAKLIEKIREATPRHFGVIDGGGILMAASTETSLSRFIAAADHITSNDGQDFILDGYSFRVPEAHEAKEPFDYAVFVEGDDPHAFTVAVLAAIALQESKSYGEEKVDKSLFLKNLISDNTLLSELFSRARELHIPVQARRAVFLVRQEEHSDPLAADLLRGLFSDSQTEFVFAVDDADLVLIKEYPERQLEEFEDEGEEYEATAKQIIEALNMELFISAVVGIGSTANHLRELPERYKEAQVAIDVGKVFSDKQRVLRYDHLGIGRIIYQLPNTLCEMFLNEVFKKNPIDALDAETLFTINKFFENNLNVSETSRKLFVHRNTLVYRLEKIKKVTGLDLREFDHAIVLKVALMVRRYLDTQQ